MLVAKDKGVSGRIPLGGEYFGTLSTHSIGRRAIKYSINESGDDPYFFALA
jgi:hypothetical protein